MDITVTKESLLSEPLAPEGTPYLMQNQEYAFNGDIHLAEEILRLKEKHDIDRVVETGTYIGTTTIWFAKNFQYTISAEIVSSLHAIAWMRTMDIEDVNTMFCSGASLLSDPEIMSNDPLVFLDAHPIDGSGKGYDVVVQELEAIAQSGCRPSVIVLHDFQVPGRPELQFDRFDGKPFTYEWVKPSLDKIYGENGYSYHYNSHATGAKVGVLFIEKKP